MVPIPFSGHFVLQINISLNESIQTLCLVNCLPKYSACTREINKENGWAQKLCKQGVGLNTHLSREFSGVTFRSADTLVLVMKFFLGSGSVCLFSFEKCYFKNRAAKFPCLPHGKKISTGILRMLKGLSISARAFDFIWFHFFFPCPLSLSFLSHWLCDESF